MIEDACHVVDEVGERARSRIELQPAGLALREDEDPVDQRQERLAANLPNAQLVEPPWGDTEWNDRSAAYAAGGALFDGWPKLVPQLLDWADENIAG